MTVKALLGYLLQYASALALIAATVWFIAKPHAEEFITDTVAARFTKVEAAQQAIVDDIGVLTATVESSARINAAKDESTEALKQQIQKLLLALPETPQ